MQKSTSCWIFITSFLVYFYHLQIPNVLSNIQRQGAIANMTVKEVLGAGKSKQYWVIHVWDHNTWNSSNCRPYSSVSVADGVHGKQDWM